MRVELVSRRGWCRLAPYTPRTRNGTSLVLWTCGFYFLKDFCSVFMTNRSATMNLKLNNDIKSSTTNIKSAESLVKEERRRTGRYIAILVGIMLFILALYHAWVRRIPIVASLVVPALIMFIYVAWVLYTASRDKHRLMDAEAALQAQQEAEQEFHISELSHNLESISSKENSNLNSPSEASYKGENNVRTLAHGFVLPIILINDKPPEDLDQKWLNIVEKVSGNDKVRGLTTRRKYRRKFCRKRRYIAKRSYSIG